MTHRTLMSDLQCVEYAVQCVLAECRKENPHRMSTPADGETVMLRFAAALNEAKEIRDGDGEVAPSAEKET